MIGTGFPFRDSDMAARYLPTFEALFGHCASIRGTGSAALDLAYVASGRLDGYWRFGLKPWDIAAGALIIQEAGGLISDLQGGEDYLRHGDVVAGTPKVFKSLLQTMAPVTRA
jgi:myo-inositol-1(or 4)-monophosphatase